MKKFECFQGIWESVTLFGAHAKLPIVTTDIARSRPRPPDRLATLGRFCRAMKTQMSVSSRYNMFTTSSFRRRVFPAS